MPKDDGTMTRYEYRKIQHRCVQCGTRDAYTMNGRAKCAECLEKDRQRYARDKGPELSERMERYRRIRESEREEAGLCVLCGKRPPEPGRRRCAVCNAKSRERYRAVSEKKPIHQNPPWYCSRCHKAPPMDGKRLCEACYENVVQTLYKARAVSAEKNETHPWREYWEKDGGEE